MSTEHQTESESPTEAEPSRSELQNRIERLEEEVRALRPAGVSRRDLLAGGAAVGVGAAAGPSLSELVFGSAKADTAAGDIGTSTDPVDAFLSYASVADTATDPAANGEIQRNGTDLKVYSGGAVRTLSTVPIAKVASGQATLSSGTGTVTTGISATDATFYLALGVDDPNADAKITGRLFFDDSAGTYKIELVEDGTSVGNPTVNYDVLRVR